MMLALLICSPQAMVDRRMPNRLAADWNHQSFLLMTTRDERASS
jgi:hypothetical protein